MDNLNNSEKKLREKIEEIRTIYLDSKQAQPIGKKYQNYQKMNILVNNAKQFIESLQKEISEIEPPKNDKLNLSKVNELVDLLSMPNLKFDEVLYIVSELKKISARLPKTAHITNNIEKEVIYEEEEVDSFE